MLNQDDFFTKYKIDKARFDATTISWTELQAIADDYEQKKEKLEGVAQMLANNLMKTEGVHSVRYRVKDTEHLIEKIIRKRIGDAKRVITIENYSSDITDLIGLRAIHLFKEDWERIHSAIKNTWQLKEKPIAYIREGDLNYPDAYKKGGCKVAQHQYGYRSIHYIIITNPTKIAYYAEIQVRTIFEEGWSEIDHKIRYPYDIDNLMYQQYLSIFNRLAGSADEMGTFIKMLREELLLSATTAATKEQEINSLKEKIANLKGVNKEDKDDLTENVNKITLPDLNRAYPSKFLNQDLFDKISKLSGENSLSISNALLKSALYSNSSIAKIVNDASNIERRFNYGKFPRHRNNSTDENPKLEE